MTCLPELMAADANVALGHDSVMGPWYGMASGDQLEVAHMGLHVVQMTSQKGIRQCFNAVITNAAKVMHLQGYPLRWSHSPCSGPLGHPGRRNRSHGQSSSSGQGDKES